MHPMLGVLCVIIAQPSMHIKSLYFSYLRVEPRLRPQLLGQDRPALLHPGVAKPPTQGAGVAMGQEALVVASGEEVVGGQDLHLRGLGGRRRERGRRRLLLLLLGREGALVCGR